jgi:hypothetical protein
VGSDAEGTLSRIDPGTDRVVATPFVSLDVRNFVLAGGLLWIAVAGGDQVVAFRPAAP